MEQVAMPAMTLADLDAQEKHLTQLRDTYVTEANKQIAAYSGAIHHIQGQRTWLLEKQKEQAKAAQKPRRGKVKPKKNESPTLTDVVNASELLTA